MIGENLFKLDFIVLDFFKKFFKDEQLQFCIALGILIVCPAFLNRSKK